MELREEYEKALKDCAKLMIERDDLVINHRERLHDLDEKIAEAKADARRAKAGRAKLPAATLEKAMRGVTYPPGRRRAR